MEHNPIEDTTKHTTCQKFLAFTKADKITREVPNFVTESSKNEALIFFALTSYVDMFMLPLRSKFLLPQQLYA
jgi:hypothetical protein